MPDAVVTAVGMAKGGVGRTTVAVNGAERLAARGRDVLLVDSTDQGGATAALDAGDTAEPTLGDVLGGNVELPDALVERAGMDLLRASEDPAAVREMLKNPPEGIVQLVTRVIAPARRRYDHVLVDTSPVIDTLSDAALAGADRVLLVTGASEADIRALSLTLDRQIIPLRREIPLPIAGIVPNRLRGTREQRRVLSLLAGSDLGTYLPVDPDANEPEGLRERTAFPESWREGLPLARYAPDSDMVARLDRLADMIAGDGARGA